MAKNKLYQCPYNEASKCCMQDPCLGCEDFLPEKLAVKNFTASNNARDEIAYQIKQLHEYYQPTELFTRDQVITMLRQL